MKSFKEFIREPEEFVAFSNAGGRLGQYEKFDYTRSYLHGQGGGRPDPIDENLNPRKSYEQVHEESPILYDPEKENKNLGHHLYLPKNIGIPDKYNSGHVNPQFNVEQAKNAKILSDNTNEGGNYHSIIHPYTENSYNLNNTLILHHDHKTTPPNIIKSHLDNGGEGSEINTKDLDDLINSHNLPHEMTVYSGLHFHPNEHRKKIATLPSYLSTSLSPHIAKDFGKEWELGFNDGKSDRTVRIKNILRLHLPKGHPHLFADNGSHFPGQGEVILPRNMRYQLGQQPTHMIHGKFINHLTGKLDDIQYHVWTGRLLPRK